jgi:GNAT superfamily N-acetyltransferase
MPETVRAATRADVPAIAATLAAAFVDDPVKQHLTGLAHVPPERSIPFFDAFTRIQLPHGHVYVAEVDGEIRGAALWSPPGHWKVPMRTILRWGPRFIRMYGRRFLANLNVLLTVEKHHPREPHYYLEFLGVHPAAQGKGLGRDLVEVMVEIGDREGVPLYLENSKEKNLAFYGRHGFQPREPMHLPGRNGPAIWPMWRDPR